MTRRFFSKSERAALWLRARGRCEACGTRLLPGWHADHVIPYAESGPTEVINGAALCPPCNLRKGKSMVDPFVPRPWQQTAVEVARARIGNGKRTIVLSHCPGSGKTITAALIDLEVRRMLGTQRTVYFAPRLALIAGTCNTFHRLGTALSDPDGNAPPLTLPGTVGFAQSYQSLARAGAESTIVDCDGRPYHLVIDEAQFAGSATSNGAALRELVDRATFVTIMSATLERSDRTPIAGVDYGLDGMPLVHHEVAYRAAASEGEVRDIDLRLEHMDMTWDDGQEQRLSEVEDGLFHALTSERVWEPMADRFVEMLRRRQAAEPREKGVVFACGQRHARDIQAYLKRHGLHAAIAVSDDEAQARPTLRAFPEDHADVLVTVQKVGIGFDAPRIGTVLYLSNVRHEPAIYQAVARACRVDPMSRIGKRDQTMCVIAPSDARMSTFLRWLEAEARQGIEDRGQGASEASGEQRERIDRSVMDTAGFAESAHGFNGELDPDVLARIDAEAARHGIGFVAPLRLHLFLQTMTDPQQPPAPPRSTAAPQMTPREQRTELNKRIASTLSGWIHRNYPGLDQKAFSRLMAIKRAELGPRSDRLTVEELTRLADRAARTYGDDAA